MADIGRARKLLLIPIGLLAAAGLSLAAMAGAEHGATVRAGGYGTPTCDSNKQIYDTRITKAPKGRTGSTKATIKFEAFYCNVPNTEGPDASSMAFECRLDKGKAKKCSTPVKYKHLKKGKHKVEVAVTGTDFDPKSGGDPTPDVAKWKVVG
jgi:hypothetical protein